MHIFFLAPHPFFQNRGTPIAVKLMLETLSAEGHQIKVLTYPEGEDIAISNCEIIRLSPVPGVKHIKPGPSWKKMVYDISMFFKAQQLMGEYRFDIIHAVEESVFIARYLNKSFGIPYIYDMDSSLPQQIAEKFSYLRVALPVLDQFEKFAVRGSIGVIPVCRSIEDTVKKYDPTVLIQRLEDISFLPSKPLEGLDKNRVIKKNGPVLMYVGNLEKYQGIDLLLESFQIASRKIPETNLVIIGGSEKDINYYQTVSNKLGIAEKTVFLGPRPISELPHNFAQADILVSPRVTGYNTPMKIYSYLDSGKPVLATRLQTHTQVLDDEIAYLAEANVQAMAEGMIALLQDKGLRERLAKNAKSRVEKEFTLDAFRRKLSMFYGIVESKIT